MDRRLSIRQVSERYCVSARTLRFYEEAGLLQSSRREGSGCREYDGAGLRRLELILLLRGLSFSIKEITELLNGSSVFQNTLRRRVASSDKQLLELREINGLLQRLETELADKPPEDILAADILSGLVYATKKTERMLGMTVNDKLVILGSCPLIVDITSEKIGDLAAKIPKLRAELEASGKTLPVVRIMDDVNLTPNTVIILYDGAEAWRKDFGPESDAVAAAGVIIEELKRFA